MRPFMLFSPPTTSVALATVRLAYATPSVNITVTVSSSTGTPTGTVTLVVDGILINTLALTNGSATFLVNTQTFPYGEHFMVVSYTPTVGSIWSTKSAGAIIIILTPDHGDITFVY